MMTKRQIKIFAALILAICGLAATYNIDIVGGPTMATSLVSGYGFDARAYGAILDTQGFTGTHCTTNGTTCPDDGPALFGASGCVQPFAICMIPNTTNGGTTHVRVATGEVYNSNDTAYLMCNGADQTGGITTNTGTIEIDVDMGGATGPMLMLGSPNTAPFNGVVFIGCHFKDISTSHNSPGVIAALNYSNPYFERVGFDNFRSGTLATATVAPAAASALVCTPNSGGSINATSFPITMQWAALGPGWGTGPATGTVSVSAANAGASGATNTCVPGAPATIDTNAVAVQIFVNGFQAGLPYVCSSGTCAMNHDFSYGQSATSSTSWTTLPSSGNGPDAFDHSGAYGFYFQGTAGFNCTIRTSDPCQANQFSNQPRFLQIDCDNMNKCWDFDNKVAGPYISLSHCNIDAQGVQCLLSESGIICCGNSHWEGGTNGSGPMMTVGGASSSTVTDLFCESGSSITCFNGFNLNKSVISLICGNALTHCYADDSTSGNNLVWISDFVGDVSAQTSDTVMTTSGKYNTIPNVRYSVLHGATSASISNLQMLLAPSTVTTKWEIGFYAVQIGAGTSCVSNTEIVANVNFVDPVAGGATTVPVAAFVISNNGTANTPIAPLASGAAPATVISGAGGYVFQSNAGSAIKYSTTVTAGGSCSPAPTYQIMPILQLL